MSLTHGTGPLSPQSDGVLTPPTSGPTSFVEPYPRRVRALIGGEAVLDTEDAVMLHAPGRLPSMWFPRDAIGGALRAHEPRAGDPVDALGDRLLVPFGAAERWFIEDEPVSAHFRDPYHRVDVTRSSRHVVVRVGGEVVADTVRPRLLFETGLPVRYYVPWSDVRLGAFERSATVSECPYKGDGQHWHATAGGERVEDAAWSLPHPLPEGFAAHEHVAFYPDRVELEVDGRRVTD